MNNTMVITNIGLGDTIFDADFGSWNITRAIRDCLAGKHEIYKFEVDKVFAVTDKVEVDQKKIDKLIKVNDFPPLIFVVFEDAVWLIDGHHRLHALKKRGVKEVLGYVIEEEDVEIYAVYYNGERVAPWYREIT